MTKVNKNDTIKTNKRIIFLERNQNMEQDLSRKLMEQDRKLNEILRYINTKKAEETKRTTLVNEFAELNTLDTFMKAKANTFSIGKVLFSFVKFDKKTMKSLESMDVYMDMDDALLFANDVLNGRIATLAAEEKAKAAASLQQFQMK